MLTILLEVQFLNSETSQTVLSQHNLVVNRIENVNSHTCNYCHSFRTGLLVVLAYIGILALELATIPNSLH